MRVFGSVVYACNGLDTVVIVVAWRGEWCLVLWWCGDMDLIECDSDIQREKGFLLNKILIIGFRGGCAV